MNDIFHQLKIALAVREESLLGLSKKWDVSDTHLRYVAKGHTISSPMRDKIENYIAEAQKLVHSVFLSNRPTNEQTNEQNEKVKNRSLETV